MTNQLLSRSSSENPKSNLSRSTHQTVKDHQMTQVRKSYQAIQQVKYLHLKAEIDVLLQQLQSLNNN